MECEQSHVAQCSPKNSERNNEDDTTSQEDDFQSRMAPFDLDESSETEGYPSEEESDDVSCSSGEDEGEFLIEERCLGGMKLLKLKFKDVAMMNQNMQSHADDEDLAEDSEQGIVGQTALILSTCSEMEAIYNSDEDEDFDPMCCGETLSDVEYTDGDERDTESEPEVEVVQGVHSKTGEPHICLKHNEQGNSSKSEAGVALGVQGDGSMK